MREQSRAGTTHACAGLPLGQASALVSLSWQPVMRIPISFASLPGAALLAGSGVWVRLNCGSPAALPAEATGWPPAPAPAPVPPPAEGGLPGVGAGDAAAPPEAGGCPLHAAKRFCSGARQWQQQLEG